MTATDVLKRPDGFIVLLLVVFFTAAYPSGVRLVTGNMMFSYKNPRDWTNLTTEQVAEDILGLSQDWSIV